MAARFTALASGSAGNACFVESRSAGVLIDFGIGPRSLATRMAARGLSWCECRPLCLRTRIPTTGAKRRAHFHKLGVRLFCHLAHVEVLAAASNAFNELQSAGLVQLFVAGRSVNVAPGLTALPLPVRHDVETFGFRFEGDSGLFGPGWSLGYAADLGCWDNELARSLSDVDLLALEFNHDEQMQHRTAAARSS